MTPRKGNGKRNASNVNREAQIKTAERILAVSFKSSVLLRGKYHRRRAAAASMPTISRRTIASADYHVAN
jgi:hypothetical protein